MTKRVLAVVVGALAILGACSPGDNFRDVEGAKSQDPDLIEVFNNVDQHPNIVKVCIDGVAFRTITREHDSVQRVEAWDSTCPGANAK